MTAKTLMIQGTGSSVGKSLFVTALCRIFARRGLRVAPFKTQNMSLNSFITEEGLEMGRAQVAQAEAAGIAPSALMNPVLLKPCGESTCQVIINGRVRATMGAKEYYAFRHTLKAEVMQAFKVLAEDRDLIFIEGAGSPAEINLRENDIANMGMAEMADAPVVLIGDIHRGGVFASLFGTVKLLEPAEQRRIRGFIINKFRGDLEILAPGLRDLEYILARPVLGVLPWLDVHIDEEDSLIDRLTGCGTEHEVSMKPPSPPGEQSGHTHTDFKQSQYDLLADQVEACLDMEELERIVFCFPH
jgi:adenosylcobyric acid synthase